MVSKHNTVEELQAEIRKLTLKANESIKIYRQDSNNNALVNQAINRLQTLGAKGTRGDVVGLGFRGKTKASLLRQARELEYFNRLGINTEAGQIYLEEKFQKSFETFKENPAFEDYTEEEHRQLVEAFGAVGEDVVEKYDSNAIAEAYLYRGKEINLAKLMLDTIRENKGATSNELTTRLVEKMREV